MLSPDNNLGIFAALMGLAALAFWLQTTRLGALLTGTVLVILMAIVAANPMRAAKMPRWLSGLNIAWGVLLVSI